MFRSLILVFAAASMTASTVSTAEEAILATRRQIDALDRVAGKEPTAGRALELYHQFLSIHTIPYDLQTRFNQRFETWEERAEEQLVRLGTKWVSVEKRDTAAAEAREMVREAFALLKVGDREGAGKKLFAASKHDPNGILSDYLIGLFNSGRMFDVTVSHPESAIKHFKKVLKRSPSHVGAMNNLAVAYVKDGEPNKALAIWKKAKEIEPANSAIEQNLRRTLLENNRGTIKIKRSTLAKIRDLFGNSDSDKANNKSDLVWAISPAIVPDSERVNHQSESSRTQDTRESTAGDGQKLVSAGTGTGFVVADGIVLTNRHVVETDSYGTGDAFRIKLPGSSDTLHDATLVAMSDKDDLALLKCERFSAPPLKLTMEAPRLAQELMVVGYPYVDDYDDGVKTTVGVMTGLPGTDYPRLLYDATTNPGNSGGPVLGRDGTVLAVHMAGTLTAKPLGVGVPASRVIEFISANIPGVTAIKKLPKQEWAQIAEVVSKSTVLIELFYTANNSGFAARENNDYQLVEYYSDVSCAHCNGWSQVPCPEAKCRGGAILKVKKYQTKDYIPFPVKGGRKYVINNRRKSVNITCRTCSGKNVIDCRFCERDGIAR